jgi:hypothetical protein
MAPLEISNPVLYSRQLFYKMMYSLNIKTELFGNDHLYDLASNRHVSPPLKQQYLSGNHIGQLYFCCVGSVRIFQGTWTCKDESKMKDTGLTCQIQVSHIAIPVSSSNGRQEARQSMALPLQWS